MGSSCCKSDVTAYPPKNIISHHHGSSDQQFTAWLYQQQKRYGMEKSVFDDLLACYVQRQAALRESERDDWLREQIKRIEQEKIREIHERYEKEVVQIENSKELKAIHEWYEKELRRIEVQYQDFYKEQQKQTQDLTLHVTEENLIGPVVISPQIKIQMGEIQKQEEKFLKWLHEKEKAESLDDSEFMKYLKLHVEGYHVPGWPRKSKESDVKEKRNRFRLESAEKDVIHDLYDNLEQDIRLRESQLTRSWLKLLLKNYRKDQHRKLMPSDEKAVKEAEDEADTTLIDELMKNLEDGENVQSMKDRVCDYLTEHYTESDDGIYLDPEEVEEIWKFPDGCARENLLACIQVLKLALAKKVKAAEKARKEAEEEKKREEVSSGDKTYIGQLTEDDFEDREKLTKEIGDRLMEICEEEEDEKIFNDVRLAAEEEIREHPDDITADVLLGVMEKYRDKQWEIISTETVEETEDEPDTTFIDELMKNLEDGENVQSMKDRVCDYLTEHYTELDEDIHLDPEEVEEIWKFPDRCTKENLLACIQVLKLALAKKVKAAEKARKEAEEEKKREEVSSGDKTYIGQLTEDDFEDREKLAKEVGDRLMEICEEQEKNEKIFNDVRLAAEEEIHEHPDDITADVLLGVMEKYRDKQWEIISTERNTGEDVEGEETVKHMSDAEFVDKIITEEVDAAKLADLLRQRIARTDESDESDHFSEVTQMIGQEMKEEILDLEGEVNTREILAILLKYKKRHREALRDSETVKHMSDAEFVDKIITEEVDAAKLADLLRQRIARTDESDESDDFREVTQMIGQEMKEEILDLEGEVNTREILAILLKYKKRHREALRDSETKYEEDEDFVEGIEDEELEDKEHVVGKILSHLSDEKYFLMGDLAAEYAVPEHDEEHSDSSDLDEMKDVEESEALPGMIKELQEDDEYGEKLNALNEALQELLKLHKGTMSRDELLQILLEYQQQIALLVESKVERDYMRDERENNNNDLQIMRERSSVTSEDYKTLMKEFETRQQKLKDMRENEKHQLHKRFKMILAAKLQSKCERIDDDDSDKDEEIDVTADISEAIEKKKRGIISEEDFVALMRGHMVEKLSIQEHRGKEKGRIQEKLRQALERRHVIKDATEDTEEDSQDQTELRDVDKKFKKELRERVTEADVQELVKRYRNEREALLQERGIHKKKLDDKLEERLKQKKQAALEEEKKIKKKLTASVKEADFQEIVKQHHSERRRCVQERDIQRKNFNDKLNERLKQKLGAGYRPKEQRKALLNEN